MAEKWFLTWRHMDESPLLAMVIPVSSREQGVIRKSVMLAKHARFGCVKCRIIDGREMGEYVKGNNDYLVASVRTQHAIQKALGYKT